MEATDPISRMFNFAEMLTIFKGLEKFISSDMPVRSDSLHGNLACFCVTMSSSMLR